MNKWSKLVISAVVAGFVSHAAFANEEAPAPTDAATGEAPKAEAGKTGCSGKGGCKGHKKAKKAKDGKASCKGHKKDQKPATEEAK